MRPIAHIVPRAAARMSRALNIALVGALLLATTLTHYPPLSKRGTEIARDCVLMQVGRLAEEGALTRTLDFYLLQMRCEAAAAVDQGQRVRR